MEDLSKLSREELERKCTGALNELHRNIKDKEDLLCDVEQRPLKLDPIAFFNVESNHSVMELVYIAGKARGTMVKVIYKGEAFWVLPVMPDDKDDPSGVYGLVRNVLLNEEVAFNDLVHVMPQQVVAITGYNSKQLSIDGHMETGKIWSREAFDKIRALVRDLVDSGEVDEHDWLLHNFNVSNAVFDKMNSKNW